MAVHITIRAACLLFGLLYLLAVQLFHVYEIEKETVSDGGVLSMSSLLKYETNELHHQQGPSSNGRQGKTRVVAASSSSNKNTKRIVSSTTSFMRRPAVRLSQAEARQEIRTAMAQAGVTRDAALKAEFDFCERRQHTPESMRLDALYSKPTVPIDPMCRPDPLPSLYPPSDAMCRAAGYSRGLRTKKGEGSSSSSSSFPVITKVIDLMPWGNEVDVLEMRLWELNETVDEFIIVESPISHTVQVEAPVLRQLFQKDARFTPFASKTRILTAFTGDLDHDHDADSATGTGGTETETEDGVHSDHHDSKAGAGSQDVVNYLSLHNISRESHAKNPYIVEYSKDAWMTRWAERHTSPTDLVLRTHTDEIPTREMIWMIRHCAVPLPLKHILWFPFGLVDYVYKPDWRLNNLPETYHHLFDGNDQNNALRPAANLTVLFDAYRQRKEDLVQWRRLRQEQKQQQQQQQQHGSSTQKGTHASYGDYFYRDDDIVDTIPEHATLPPALMRRKLHQLQQQRMKKEGKGVQQQQSGISNKALFPNVTTYDEFEKEYSRLVRQYGFAARNFSPGGVGGHRIVVRGDVDSDSPTTSTMGTMNTTTQTIRKEAEEMMNNEKKRREMEETGGIEEKKGSEASELINTIPDTKKTERQTYGMTTTTTTNVRLRHYVVGGFHASDYQFAPALTVKYRHIADGTDEFTHMLTDPDRMAFYSGRGDCLRRTARGKGSHRDKVARMIEFGEGPRMQRLDELLDFVNDGVSVSDSEDSDEPGEAEVGSGGISKRSQSTTTINNRSRNSRRMMMTTLTPGGEDFFRLPWLLSCNPGRYPEWFGLPDPMRLAHSRAAPMERQKKSMPFLFDQRD